MASTMLSISRLLLLLLQTLLLITTIEEPIEEFSVENETQFFNTPQVSNFPIASNPTPNSLTESSLLTSLQYPILRKSKVVVFGNSTLSSANKTFALDFFSPNGDKSNWYLGIRYASIPVPTCVWVANRERPIKNLTFSSLEISGSGRLVVKDPGNSIVWSSTNTEIGVDVQLLDSGNLVLLTQGGTVAWQSFDYPTDTWLPGMNLTSERVLTSWRSYRDPSPGSYSLRLRPPNYGEFELLFNGTVVYWRTGNWTGNGFINVPEMLVPYIYKFHFIDPFKPTASFGFTEEPLDNGLDPPLTRFQMDVSGQLQQFTWATQTWNMFWSQPENKCRVFGLCGAFGVCSGEALRPCECLAGFNPVDEPSWNYGDYSGGCRWMAKYGESCDERGDGFDKVGVVSYEGSYFKSYRTTLDDCQSTCLEICSCIGVNYDGNSTVCKVYYGSLSNLKNLSSDGAVGEVFYLRVQKNLKVEIKKQLSPVVLSASIVGSVAGLGFVVVLASNLKVFSYKELHTATRAQQIIDGNVRAVLDDRLGCTYSIEQAERVALVAVWCIQDSEAMRPTMGMVVKMLEGVVEVTVPPAPKLLQALVSGESFCGIKADSGIGLSNGSDFSGYNTRLSSCGSESSLGNGSSLVNEIEHDNQRSSVAFTG
ncbi:G-type lectin S-receptor-like serine/threonine-protein kinase SD2-2 [Prunus yedoensis var. nudiflora]|uniref:G-type lectin S-receptor-like serine/threonine-protein kinase SD2-2 n=1 Tax=Prunus yedoensis var. nudiflora TaxID=2094558 RepID=A0A314UPQ4_PRUYE|nr:G-type lectin S-receptor-like serine/threonine-protein kinase SD2-2 [Prunus yedoensis var. nudiflora]